MIKKLFIFFLILIGVSFFLGKDNIFLSVDILFNLPPFYNEMGAKPQNSLLADPVFQFEPWRVFVKESLLRGEFPLWNPYNAGGAPFLANLQNAAFFPLSFLYYIFPTGPALFLIHFLKIIILFFFTYLYLRAIKLGKEAAGLGAITASFFAFPIVWLQWPHTNVFLVFPLILYLIEKLIATTSKRLAILLIAVAYFVGILGGHPETLFHISLLSIAYAILRSTRKLDTLYVLLGFIIGILLGSFILLPFLEYLLNSAVLYERSSVEPTHHLPILAFIYLFIPYATGAPHLLLYKSVWSTTNFQEYIGGYTGIGVIVFALLGVIKFFRQKIIRIWILFFIGSFLFVYKLPFIGFLTDLPIISISANHRLVGFLGFSLVVIASYYIDWFLKNQKTIVYRFWTQSVIGFIFLAVVSLVWIINPLILLEPKVQLFSKIQSFQFLIIILSILFLTLSLRVRVMSKFFVCLALLIPLVGILSNYNSIIEKKYYYPNTDVIKTLQKGNRILEVGNPNFPENLNLVYGVEHAQNYDALEVSSYKKAFDYAFPVKNHWGNPDEAMVESLDKFGIDTIISDYNLNFDKSNLFGGREEILPNISQQKTKINFVGREKELVGIRFITANFNRKNSCSFLIVIRNSQEVVLTEEISCLNIPDNMFYTVEFVPRILHKNEKYEIEIHPINTSPLNAIAFWGKDNAPYIDLIFNNNKGYQLVHSSDNIRILKTPFKIYEYEGIINSIQSTSTSHIVELKGAKDLDLLVKYTNYAGWKAKVNNKAVEIDKSSPFIKLKIPEGNSLVEIYYQPLPFIIGSTTSSITLFFVILFFLKEIYLKNKKRLQKIGGKYASIATPKFFAFCLSISLVSFLLYSYVFYKLMSFFKVPETTAINWFTVHNYPKHFDYYYIVVGVGLVWLVLIVCITLWKKRK